jgi:DNA-directed RNA polymerase II subunit RPB1
MSVCEVSNPIVMDLEGRPTRGGINDLRMGTVDKTVLCETCKSNFTDCPGHFGHIKLEKPMYHVGFIEVCRKILRCICFNCSQLLISKDRKFDEVIKIKNLKKRQNLMYNLCKNYKKCELPQNHEREDSTENSSEMNDGAGQHKGCGYIQPHYKKDKNDPLKIIIELNDDVDDTGGEKNRGLSAEECLRIFRKISNEDCIALGFDPPRSRPDWMILTYLIVCPPQVRPSVSVDSTLRCEDDLTFQYVQILKVNSQLRKEEEKGAAGHVLNESGALLQFFVATLMNNEISSGSSQQRSGRPIKAISTRLKGKEGRLRGTLMGKRVDFSARTVITPDPNLSLDELGVPLSIALNLTFPEVVTPMNIEFLRKLVENGPTEWPGAHYIVRDDGTRIDLRFLKKRSDIHLAYGYVVGRHMQNGDFVLFNRQPSLHKMSIMGHRVRVLPYSTFRLNLSVTTPYNADFDGDEMNMHLPQSLETKAEIVEIMHVPKQIVSPQSNRPVMGIVQDSLIGVKLFTHRDNYITIDALMNLIMWISDFDGNIPVPAILKPKPLWTGKQIFSLILPKINLVRFTANHDDNLTGHMSHLDTEVLIEKGELIKGIVCKRTVGNASGGLIHCIWNEYGPTQTMWFLNHTQRVVNQWLLLSGFTVGVCDIISDKKTNEAIKQTMDLVKDKVKNILVEAQQGHLECQPGKSMIESFESKVNSALNEARDTAGRHVQGSLKNNNHLKNMVIAGSKGNVTNISQIIACVGQQNVEGKRIPFSFNKRTLPHFTKDDYGPESRGFVENSYLSGLTPQEFFFHAMGGREGLIDTAVKTSETGYIQRRLVKALEDVMVKYDGTVRNSLQHVIQFLYGEDGMTGELIEDQTIETLLMDNERIKNKFKFFEDDLDITDEYALNKLCSKMEKFMHKELVRSLVHSDEFPSIKFEVDAEFEDIFKDRNEMRDKIFKNGDDRQHFPVNISRIIWNAKKNFGITNQSLSDLNPSYILLKKLELKQKLILVKGTDFISQEAQKNSTLLFSVILNYSLSVKRLIVVERLSTCAFDYIIGEIENRFNQSIVKPGEMVGSVAAQSMGEPATQMTLNTFHFAGVSAKNVTLGVPRLKEVINVAKRLKTPSMTIFLKKEYSNSEDAKSLQTVIEHTSMMNVTASTEIIYDPDPLKTINRDDEMMVELDAAFRQTDILRDLDRFSPWVLRIELDNNSMLDKGIEIDLITEKLLKRFNDIDIISSDTNAEKLIIRIRMRYNPSEKKITKEQAHSEEILKNLENVILKDLSLKGISQIKKVYAKEAKRPAFDNSTGSFSNNTKEWVIETDGTNLYEVFLNEKVDFTRVISNDINEIYACLGVEAVRKALINELRAVLRPYDVYVNYRHIAILCDVMTQSGKLTAITRHGINRLELGPLRKSSFEETVEILLEAGLFSETDKLTGISENIMLGQLAPFGTGCFDLLLDTKMIEKAKVQEEEMEVDEVMNTPLYDGQSPIQTPFMQTPNMLAGNVSMYTPNRGASPSFTPGYEVPKSPYMYSSNAGVYNYIMTPNPMVSPGGFNSPNYNPSDYAKTPQPYSPKYDYDESFQTQRGYNIDSINYSPSSLRSPYIDSVNNRQTASPYGVSPGYSKGVSRYLETTSPMYSGGASYSPTTPNYPRSSNSPELHNYSNYSGSPRIHDSGSSHPSHQYSPRSPAYNPKSPSYNIMQSCKYFI